jgi:hypothetical protein
MDTYLVISNHTEEDCNKAIEYFMQFHKGYLVKFEWGCLDHDHNAYAIIEAESHEHAKMSVPPLFRDKARSILLTRFTEMPEHTP